MRVEIAACVMAFSVAMWFPGPAQSPGARQNAARPLPRGSETPLAREARLRALPTLVRNQGPRGKTVSTVAHIEINKNGKAVVRSGAYRARTADGEDSAGNKNADNTQDFTRLQRIW